MRKPPQGGSGTPPQMQFPSLTTQKRLAVKYRSAFFQLMDKWKQDMIDLYETSPGDRQALISLLEIGMEIMELSAKVKEILEEGPEPSGV